MERMLDWVYRVGLIAFVSSFALLALGNFLAYPPIFDYVVSGLFGVFVVGGLILLLEALGLIWRGNGSRSPLATISILLLLVATSVYGSYVVHALYAVHRGGKRINTGEWLFGAHRPPPTGTVQESAK